MSPEEVSNLKNAQPLSNIQTNNKCDDCDCTPKSKKQEESEEDSNQFCDLSSSFNYSVCCGVCYSCRVLLRESAAEQLPKEFRQKNIKLISNAKLKNQIKDFLIEEEDVG